MGLFLGEGLEVRHKADRTVVTQADTSIEAMVREQVAAAFPDDHVLGEEEGGGDRATGRVWIVDPIDATANYARGIPVWATLIALQVDGELVLGLVNAPAIGERYEAVRGGGARMNGRPIGVSAIGELGEAQLFHAGLEAWGPEARGRLVALLGRLGAHPRVRRLLGAHARRARRRRGDAGPVSAHNEVEREFIRRRLSELAG